MADAHSTEVVWRPVEDWPGYEVSSNGDARVSPWLRYHATSIHVELGAAIDAVNAL